MLFSAPRLIVEGDVAPAPRMDRCRSDVRVRSVIRVARVITACSEGLALIRNLSDQGAGLRMLLPAMPTDRLTLELADHVQFQGKIIWKSGDDHGVQFDQRVDCCALLTSLAQDARLGKIRPVRLPVTSTTLIRSERGTHDVSLLDISQRGLKIAHDGRLHEGLEIQVTLPWGLDRRGIVRWTRENRAGVMLLEPLTVEMLGSVYQIAQAKLGWPLKPEEVAK